MIPLHQRISPLKTSGVLYLALLLLVIGVFAGVSSPRAGAQSFDCRECSKTGFYPCLDKIHKKIKCSFDGKHMCTTSAHITCCGGFGKIPCKFCQTGGNKAVFQNQLEDRKEYAKTARDVNKKLKLKAGVHIRTENFNLHWDIHRVKYKQRIYNRDAAAHLYAERLEALLVYYRSILGEPKALPRTGHWEIWMVKNKREEAKVAATIIGGGATKQFSQQTSTYVVGNEKATFTNDEALHANIVHHVTHLILQQGFPIGRAEYPGWFTEGMAHNFEINQFGDRKNYCTGEVATKKDRWQVGKWHGKVYSACRRDKAPTLASFATLGVKQLNSRQQAFSWSYVDFLLKDKKDKIGDFSRLMCSGKGTANAMRECFGWSLPRFHDEWTKWVKKNYAK